MIYNYESLIYPQSFTPSHPPVFVSALLNKPFIFKVITVKIFIVMSYICGGLIDTQKYFTDARISILTQLDLIHRKSKPNSYKLIMVFANKVDCDKIKTKIVVIINILC